MSSWNQSWGKALLLPGGLVFGVGYLLLSGRLIHPAPVALSSYYYAVFLCGLLLAWRFHSSRVFSALVLLLLAHRSVEFFAAGRLPAAGPERTALESVAFLLAVDWIWIGASPERGFKLQPFAAKLGALFLQSVFVAVLCRPRPAPGSDLFHRAILPPAWMVWSHLSQIPFFALLCAFFFLVVRFAITRKPADGGLAWAIVAAAAAFTSGGVGYVATGYFATAGLILIISVVEASYRMAYHDELTGLRSRRAWNDATAHLDPPYTVAVIDIDHFKQFNDLYGHDTGDEVLRMVAGRLAKVSGGGEAFRIGGEEFTILFRGLGSTEALPHLILVHRAVDDARFRLRGADRRAASRGPERRQSRRSARSPRRNSRALLADPSMLSVTVSMGVAEHRGAENIEQVVIRADKALYQAKANGRNRIETDGRPSGTGAKPPRIRKARAEGA